MLKKGRSNLWILLILVLCLVTACGRTSATDNPAENVEEAQDAAEESTADEGVILSDEGAAATNGETVSGEEESAAADGATFSGEDETIPESRETVLGDEKFEEYLPLLEGRRVALFTNSTGIVGDEVIGDAVNRENWGIGRTGVVELPNRENWGAGRTGVVELPFGIDDAGEEVVYGEHILDALIERGVRVEAVFCPEHGFRGMEDAGADVEDSVDELTGVPIISLYGSGKRGPDGEDMDRFDVLVVDMQDVGLRYYTYYITMYYLMDACAREGKAVVILDRPNPNGFYVDGPILQEEYQSGVGILPLPVVHGMTLGELARMINGEGWLSAGADACDLTVIPCGNYTHRDLYSLICRPSPNLRDMRAVYLYASTCFFENTLVSVGRGTENPFEIYGSPYLEDVDGFEFSFTPQSIAGASNPPFKGETCWGVDLREVPIEEILGSGIDVSYLIDAYHAVEEVEPGRSFWGTPDGKGQYWVDKLSGSSELRTMIEDGWTAEEIKESWQEGVEGFREKRMPYLLYEE